VIQLQGNIVLTPDINECLENTQLCDHECQNTIGRYHCYCDFGFRLNVTDGRSCIPGMTSLTILSNACKFFYLSPRCLLRWRQESCISTELLTRLVLVGFRVIQRKWRHLCECVTTNTFSFFW